jgi:hypothetical protein
LEWPRRFQEVTVPRFHDNPIIIIIIIIIVFFFILVHSKSPKSVAVYRNPSRIIGKLLVA